MNKWETLKFNYIDKNIKIIPIIPNQKTPLIENWNNDCSSDYFQILYWNEQNKDSNYAIPCYENNLFVIDLDRHDSEKDGVANFNKLINDIKDTPLNYSLFDYCDTLIQKTPSNGYHIIFKSDDDLSQVNGVANAFKDYPGIDLRNRNYILAEPSIINGIPYQFVNNKEPKEMPKELKQYILEHVSLKNDSNKAPYKKPTSVEVGDRDNQLFSYINNVYYKTRLDFDEVLCLANHFNETVIEKPFPEKTVEYKVKKCFDKDRGTMIFIKLDE